MRKTAPIVRRCMNLVVGHWLSATFSPSVYSALGHACLPACSVILHCPANREFSHTALVSSTRSTLATARSVFSTPGSIQTSLVSRVVFFLRTRFTDTITAAMPSLHFGYSFLVGLTLMRLPLVEPSRRSRLAIGLPSSEAHFHICIPSLPKLLCQVVGVLYPATILIAVIATANHFILDTVAGATIVLFALRYNKLMNNLLPLEDCLFWCLRIHKPVPVITGQGETVEKL
jgi:hypothetical protein